MFDAAATRCARLAGGRTPLLFALVVALAVVTTVTLSLDTTAVLLTPVVLSVARQLELPPLPFAFATVWLANTASLLLPVSNLTNLLAQDRLSLSHTGYLRVMALPAAVAVVLTTGLLVALHARQLRGRYHVPVPGPERDRLLFGGSATAIVTFVAGVAAGLAVWAVAGVCAALAGLLALARRPAVLRPRLVPWRLVPLVTGLLLVADAVGRRGVDPLLRDLVGGAGPVAVAAVGAVLANGMDNLPAYLALERVLPPHALPALLVGANAGPVITPWASLATLLWADRCRAAGLTVPWRTFAVRGLLLAPTVVVAGALATRG